MKQDPGSIFDLPSTPAPGPAAAESRQRLSDWLVRHCSVDLRTLGGAVMLSGTQGLQLVAVQPAGFGVSGWLVDVAAEAIAAHHAIVATRVVDGRPVCLVAHPIHAGTMVVGAVVLMLDADGVPDDNVRARWAGSALLFPVPPQVSVVSISPEAATPDPSRRVLAILAGATLHDTLAEAAASIATSLAAEMACERVSLGWRTDGLTHVVGTSDTRGRTAGTIAGDTLSALDEAMEGDATARYPVPDGSASGLIAAHARLAGALGGRSLCSVPMVWRGEPVGALLAERRADQPFDDAEARLLTEIAATATPWLAQRSMLETPLHRRLRSSLSTWRQAHDQGRWRLATFAALLAAVALFGWPVDHDISAPVKLEGAEQRVVTAPGDSYLQRVHVRPGDVVKADQLMLEFATDDLAVERERLVADLGGHDTAAGDAMGRQDLGTLAIEAAKVDESKAQIALLDQRLARARVLAPFDGVVIQGDLGNALGAPSKKGDVLLTLAPIADFRAIVEVDDSDIAEVKPGQAGAMVLTALPDMRLPVAVKRVTPLAASAQGRSFFEVEVAVDAARAAGSIALRPGMRGMARLQQTRKPWGMTWFDQASTWTRLLWWRWIG